MRHSAWLPAFILLPILLTGCGYDEFQGRFIGANGEISYEFQPDGSLEIIQGDAITTAEYEYNSGDQTIKLRSEQDLPTDTLSVTDDGHLETDDVRLNRGVDYSMLADSTWIGHQGQFTFSLTFTPTQEGMETVSELVTYYDEEKMYLSQTDNSITRLSGNKLLLDLTQYTVSNVTSESFKLSIGDNSMVFEKYPKGTEIEYSEGYQLIEE